MGLFSFFKKDKGIKEEDLPWYNLPSIFEHIQSNLDNEGQLTDIGNKLPDEERRYKGQKYRWVSGGMDGVLGHHGGSVGVEGDATKIANLVMEISDENSQSKKVDLYNILLKDNLMSLVDPALAKIAASNVSVEPHLHNYAQWLAFESPDRGPVKFGIALLGRIRDRNDMDRITTLGKHEEFTLYSAVTLSNTCANPEQELWNLAGFVDGWGKIHIVQQLRKTQHPGIKKWLIREGYKNRIMYEYLAYTCAVAGNLKEELSKQDIIDEELLFASGDIIEALIEGGPAEDMDDYDDGAAVVRLYVNHLEKKADHTPGDFLVLDSIKRYLEDIEADWKGRQEKGWTDDLISNLQIDIHRMISDPKWKQLVFEKQNSEDSRVSWQIKQVAGILGMDQKK